MREDLLHFIWKYKKLQLTDLLTTSGQSIVLIDVGLHNHLAGPDFFNAKANIANQLWAGNVEIHIKASDWYLHKHEEDSNYDNVILHVVWEDDATVFRKDNSEIPTLELKNYISRELLMAYKNLFDKRQKTFVNCEKDIAQVDSFVFQNWIERLFFERLERKSEFVLSLLKNSKNNWEQVLFSLLLKNFGLKTNGEAFLSLSYALDFSVVRKLQSDVLQLESVFFGMAHLLNDETILDTYYIQLKKEYQYAQHKFDLKNEGVIKPEFFKLRPPNFPTIRLSQLAKLYAVHQNVFNKVIHAHSIDELYSLFDISANIYWDNHFTFGKSSKKSPKRLTKKFIDLLIINSVLPLKFCYARHLGKDPNESIISIISNIKREDNSIISNFKNHGVTVKNARDTQAILQLYTEYCTKNKCLECAVGNTLLQGNV
ncbi:DUF2851 family protein [Maribacter algarum]|uniref:DUF2851 family protein n=1 Tax=Maribacter algarum (ex Zhang et al. 2020) TaxID=2578118 RepID=A0A5S3PNK4_9FLAO|nr:DUF2851 family protein [Maribacter algarum]TMM56054.1 DUF2851 family protein [Maribacter algarum]